MKFDICLNVYTYKWALYLDDTLLCSADVTAEQVCIRNQTSVKKNKMLVENDAVDSYYVRCPLIKVFEMC